MRTLAVVLLLLVPNLAYCQVGQIILDGLKSEEVKWDKKWYSFDNEIVFKSGNVVVGTSKISDLYVDINGKSAMKYLSEEDRKTILSILNDWHKSRLVLDEPTVAESIQFEIRKKKKK